MTLMKNTELCEHCV